jgi:uncharacterized cupin superfamily protein
MAVVRSIRFDRNAPVDPSAPTTTHNWYEDSTGVLSSGFWASNPNRAEVDYTEDEFCYILEGRVRLTDSAGETEEYKAGDAFVIPKGFKGVWETVEPVKKFYVIHQPKE